MTRGIKKIRKVRVAVLLLVILLILAALLVRNFFAPVKLDSSVTVTIPGGSGSSAIGRLLADAGVVRNAAAFSFYASRKELAADLRYGEYTFGPGEITLSNVLASLTKGNAADGSKNITVPEGYTLKEIAELMAKNNVCTVDEFLTCASEVKLPYDYIPPPGNAGRLEGFLFPDTYNIMDTWGAQEVINMMLAQFDKVFKEEWRQEAAKAGRSIYEITAMASIVEREAKKTEDRPVIAGVFYNRLAIDMLLQSCATVQYALGEVKPVLTNEDIAIDSPYNTYKYTGLPPGPICMPGKSSLMAAVYPADTNYLYFVAKPDGYHAFAVTYEEHLRNKALYVD